MKYKIWMLRIPEAPAHHSRIYVNYHEVLEVYKDWVEHAAKQTDSEDHVELLEGTVDWNLVKSSQQTT